MIKYDRRFDNKLFEFINFAKNISSIKYPCPEAFLDITDKLGISAVLFTDQTYGAPHTYTLIKIDEVNPGNQKIDLGIRVWDPITGIVRKPGKEPLARESLPLFLGKGTIDGLDVNRGFVFFPGKTSFNEFKDPYEEVQFYIGPVLAKNLPAPREDSPLKKHKKILEILKESYEMYEVPIGPVQDLSKNMYDCLYYNIFYALHGNLKNEKTAQLINKKELERFIVPDLLK